MVEHCHISVLVIYQHYLVDCVSIPEANKKAQNPFLSVLAHTIALVPLYFIIMSERKYKLPIQSWLNAILELINICKFHGCSEIHLILPLKGSSIFRIFGRISCEPMHRTKVLIKLFIIIPTIDLHSLSPNCILCLKACFLKFVYIRFIF